MVAESRVIVFEIEVPSIYTADFEDGPLREQTLGDFNTESEWLLNCLGEPGTVRLRVETAGEKDSTVQEVWGQVKGARLEKATGNLTDEFFERNGRRLMADEGDGCEHCESRPPCVSGGVVSLPFKATELATIELHRGGLFDGRSEDALIHLALTNDRIAGAHGPTLCGIDRFAKDGPGFSVGGGLSTTTTPCASCIAEGRKFTLPVRETRQGEIMAAALDDGAEQVSPEAGT